jgi:hypothetical protein
VNRLVGKDAGDLLLVEEGRGDGVGGGQRTKNIGLSQICKKEISFDHQMTQILLSLHTSTQQRRRIKTT